MTIIARDHSISTERGTLHARDWAPSERGDDRRATIVLLHDSLGCIDTWRDFPEQLTVATGCAVVAYDRLGFGRSDPHPGLLPFSFIRDEAETVVPRVADALGLGAIIPFGHSVGGAMAIATAARWPERCVAVITESAQSFVEGLTLAGVRVSRDAFAEPDQFERVTRRHGDKAPWVLGAWIDTWLDPAFAHWCLDDDLRQVRCPTLAMHGDSDEYGSVEHVVRIMALVRGPLRGVLLRACGHVPHRDQPVRVLAEVSRFLAPSGTRAAIERSRFRD
jgi:pimeloyl-ACP methyl ester carboxylesterase